MARINIIRLVIVSLLLTTLGYFTYQANSWYSKNIIYENIKKNSKNIWISGENLIPYKKIKKRDKLLYVEQFYDDKYNYYYQDGLILKVEKENNLIKSEVIRYSNLFTKYLLIVITVIFIVDGFRASMKYGLLDMVVAPFATRSPFEKEVIIYIAISFFSLLFLGIQ